MYFQLLHFHFDVSHSKCQANVSSRNRHCIKDYLLIPAIYNHKQIYCNVCFYKRLFRKTSGCNKLHNTVQLLRSYIEIKVKKTKNFFRCFRLPRFVCWKPYFASPFLFTDIYISAIFVCSVISNISLLTHTGKKISTVFF